MKRPFRVAYYCNAMSDALRAERCIGSDAPATTAKVGRILAALREAGVDAIAVSLGRGRVRRGPFSGRLRGSLGRVPVVYARFLPGRFLSHFVSAIDGTALLLKETKPGDAVIFYNATHHGILAVVAARLTGRRCFLDIEDGPEGASGLARAWCEAVFRWHTTFCTAGTLAAARALAALTPGRRSEVCYGVVEDSQTPAVQWCGQRVLVLMGGALLRETGVDLLLEGLAVLRNEYPEEARHLVVHVTGSGPRESRLATAASGALAGQLVFHGRLSWEEYRDLLRRCQVGLCLKLPNNRIGRSTFPSKVIEYAGHGLLVISLRVSDVPLVFGEEGAILLSRPQPSVLAAALAWIVRHREAAAAIARAGRSRVARCCSAQVVAERLLGLLAEGRLA